MFKRIITYIRTWFRGKAESAMNPEVEIEMAIDEARKQDQALRSQAAKVIAHRTKLEQRIEKSADEVAEAREMAKAAIMRAETAKEAGDADGVSKWTNSASSLAMKLTAAENNLDSLKDQYEIAIGQAETGRTAITSIAWRIRSRIATRSRSVSVGSAEVLTRHIPGWFRRSRRATCRIGTRSSRRPVDRRTRRP